MSVKVQTALPEGRASTRRAGLGVCIGFAGLLGMMAFNQRVMALDYPNKSITLVVPYPAGGSSDVVGRLVAQVLSKYVKQPVVVVNKTGAGTVSGAQRGHY